MKIIMIIMILVIMMIMIVIITYVDDKFVGRHGSAPAKRVLSPTGT